MPFESQISVLDGSIALYDAPLAPERGFPHLVVEAAPIEDVEPFEPKPGQRFVVRALLEEDFERLKQFIAALSDKSYYLRFHSSVRISDERIAAFCRLDYSREGAWVATETDEHGSERFCAVARWHITEESQTAEFGVVVRDDRQRLGLARRLMHKIETEALEAGQTTLVGYVLNGNAAMDGLMSALGFTIGKAPEHMGSEVNRWSKPLAASGTPIMAP